MNMEESGNGQGRTKRKREIPRSKNVHAPRVSGMRMRMHMERNVKIVGNRLIIMVRME
jgi:hypothetical protein